LPLRPASIRSLAIEQRGFGDRAKSDVYEAFRRMLIRGQVPTSLEELLAESAA
jgi:hypothetical protein